MSADDGQRVEIGRWEGENKRLQVVESDGKGS